jgi:hypothetical protein
MADLIILMADLILCAEKDCCKANVQVSHFNSSQ